MECPRVPDEWQVCDILFKSPVYKIGGTEKESGLAPVFRNGVLIQYNLGIKAASSLKQRSAGECYQRTFDVAGPR